MRLAARARAGSAALAAAEPQATLPDIEDEVMCVECSTALNVSTSAGRRPGARVHPPPDRRGQGQAGDQGRAGRRVRARACWRARGEGLRPRRLARARRCSSLLALAGRGACAARRWRAPAREARAAAGPSSTPTTRAPARRRAGGLRPVSGGVDTTVVAAFAVGFVSFISPCVLPLVPGYLSAVSGVSLARDPARRARSRACCCRRSSSASPSPSSSWRSG